MEPIIEEIEPTTPETLPRRSWVGTGGLSRPATPMVCNFTNTVEIYYVRDERGLMRVVNRNGYRLDKGGVSVKRVAQVKNLKNAPPEVVQNREQQRRRARRRLKKGIKLADDAFNDLYKPIEEWDMEELARGRTRNKNGKFGGVAPTFITPEIHERALERFKVLIRSEMSAQSLPALATIQMILESEEVDHRGKPIVSASAKMDAAKFLLEHVVGKPKVHVESDVSVKLQGILGQVMVNPMQLAQDEQQYVPAHVGSRELENAIDAEVLEEDDEDE